MPNQNEFVKDNQFVNQRGGALRADGSQKGLGFFGVLPRPDKKFSTELSIGVNFNGKEMEIPSIVPTLTEGELNFLLKGNKPNKVIIQKAVEFARERLGAGLSPFAQQGEQVQRPVGTK